MKKEHFVFYFLEFLLLGSGFAVILFLNLNFMQQIYVIAANLLLYIIFGVYHHSFHNNINLKVVLEYILISVLIFTLFIFINISRL